MAVLPPKLFLASSLAEEEDASNLPSDVWKISAPSKNSLFWSLILSFVISSESNGMWTRGFELLLGNDSEIDDLMKKKKVNRKPDRKSIKNQVLRYNPFRHRSSIYFNPNMTDVLRMFDLRLNRFGNGMKTKDDQWGNTFKLKAASKMLECQILLLTDCSGKFKIDSYGEPSKNGSPQIVIFFQKDVPKGEKMVDVYSFGMSLKHSFPLRLDALEHFLQKAYIHSNDIIQIRRSIQFDTNFLLSLLTSEWKRIVPIIYKSPYIAWKIADAGFNTDPCCVGQNGLSAFSYCFSFDNTFILQILYNYAVNNFQKSDESLINPNEIILECLKDVGSLIKCDCINSKNFSNLGDREDTALKISREFLLLNEYQSCIVEEKCNILQTPDQDAQQIRKFVISVLCNYFRYFNYQSSTTNLNLFENHLKFSEYYQHLDNFTCLMFFDKILLLNPVTSANNFCNTVLSLFLTVLSYKMFPKCKHGYHCSICEFTIDNCALSFISYSHRNKLEEFGKLYLEELQSDASNTSVDPNKVLQNIRLSLKDFPVITDEFLIKRLQRYLKSSIDVSLDADPIKGLLSIERAFQVIGETLPTTSNIKNIAGHLLNSCLPIDIAHKLFNIRNQCLSHYRSNLMNGRIHLENDIKRFKALQNILVTLDGMLEPLYISQEFRTEEFLIRKSEADCKKISISTHLNIRKEREIIQLLRRDQYQKHKSKYKLLSKNVLDYMHRFIERNEFKKAYEALESLRILLSFIAQQCDITASQMISGCLQKLDILLATDDKTNNQLKVDVIKNILEQRDILSDIFADTKSDKELSCTNFSELHGYFEDVKNSKWFSDQEISDIENIVTGHLKKSNATKNELLKLLTNNPPPLLEDVNKLLEDVFTSIKNKEAILTKFQTGPENALKVLEKIKDIDTNIKDIQAFTVFSEKEEGRELLLNIKFPCDLENKMIQFLNRNLECLLNRIKHLKEILIDEDDEIHSLWRWGRSSEIKRHTRFLMGQRYMRERDVRSSLEMLLFDCMNILISRKDLQELWTKATHLFSGVNLRDVLAHGSTVLEVVGGLLDPEDLPSQFIDKMLDLIEDGEALQELSDYWKKTKPKSLKQLEESISTFQGSKTSPEGKILKCKRWKDYLPLLPLKRLVVRRRCDILRTGDEGIGDILNKIDDNSFSRLVKGF